MDLLEIIAPLPATNPVKRLIEFCTQELQLPAWQVADILGRAQRVAAAVKTLSAEATHEQDERRRQEDFAQRMRELALIAAPFHVKPFSEADD